MEYIMPKLYCISWVLAFLIYHIYNPVQTVEIRSEMPKQHYSSKIDRRKLPSTAHSTAWRLSRLLVVSDALPMPPFPSDLHRSCLPFHVENNLIWEGKYNLLPREHWCVCNVLC